MEIMPGKDKKQIIKKLLEQEYLLLHINPKAPEVKIPENHAKGPVLTLKVSFRFQGRMDLNENLIQAMLLFNGQYFDCHIPWDAIWGCTAADGKNFLWPENLDPKTLASLTTQSEAASVSDDKDKSPPAASPFKKPSLKRIK